MGNVLLHLSGIMRGWTTAVFSLHENPLHHYWTLPWMRKSGKRIGWKHSPGLFVIGSLIGLAVITVFLFIIWWSFTKESGAVEQYQLLMKFSVVSLVFTVGLLLFLRNHKYLMRIGKHVVAPPESWNRSPRYMILGAVIALVIIVMLVVLAWWVFTTGIGPSARFVLSRKFSLVARYLTIGSLSFGLVLLLSRLYSVAQLALGFLEVQPRKTMRQTLDDMLVVTTLTEQEVLVGIGSHCLRLLIGPLMLVGGILTLAAVFNLIQDRAISNHLLPSLSVIGNIASVFPRFVLHGILAALALTYMLVSLGLCQRSGILPSIGAWMQLVMQVLLSASMYFFMPARWQLEAVGDSFTATWVFGLCMLMLIGLLFYLARRLSFMRNALAYAMPLLIASFGIGLYTDIEFYSMYGASEVVISSVVWALQSLTLFSLTCIPRLDYNVVFQYSGYPIFTEWWRYWLMLFFQISLVVVYAEFARDAIRRRMWGAGGT